MNEYIFICQAACLWFCCVCSRSLKCSDILVDVFGRLYLSKNLSGHKQVVFMPYSFSVVCLEKGAPARFALCQFALRAVLVLSTMFVLSAKQQMLDLPLCPQSLLSPLRSAPIYCVSLNCSTKFFQCKYHALHACACSGKIPAFSQVDF